MKLSFLQKTLTEQLITCATRKAVTDLFLKTILYVLDKYHVKDYRTRLRSLSASESATSLMHLTGIAQTHELDGEFPDFGIANVCYADLIWHNRIPQNNPRTHRQLEIARRM